MGQVLLVEDTPFFERVIKRQLSTFAGLDVISVPTRADAERVIADPAITLDVALVDLTLPDAPDGEIVDVTMAARLPTIVFSGRFDERLRDTLLAKGVVDYILKDSPASLTYLTTPQRKTNLRSTELAAEQRCVISFKFIVTFEFVTSANSQRIQDFGMHEEVDLVEF